MLLYNFYRCVIMDKENDYYKLPHLNIHGIRLKEALNMIHNVLKHNKFETKFYLYNGRNKNV